VKPPACDMRGNEGGDPSAASVVVGDPHRTALQALDAAGIPFLVGGAYALQAHLGVLLRAVKDLDLFVRPRDVGRALEVLREAGYATELTFSHWLGKASVGIDFIDIIFGSGNGVVTVDEGWFAHARATELLGLPVLLSPPEEDIWARAFVMERERFDGADVAHVLRCCTEALDWPRLLWRFGAHWRVLYAHLILFGFIYPSERRRLPAWVMDVLGARMADEDASAPPAERVCQGTLLSRAQFLIDVGRWGYVDARLQPRGKLTAELAEQWTNAIDPVAAALRLDPSDSGD